MADTICSAADTTAWASFTALAGAGDNIPNHAAIEAGDHANAIRLPVT